MKMVVRCTKNDGTNLAKIGATNMISHSSSLIRTTIYIINIKFILNPGLKIISGESPDTMTSQIHFSLVTTVSGRSNYIKLITLKTGAHEPKLALYISKKVVAQSL